jgi:hypothetical protein
MHQRVKMHPHRTGQALQVIAAFQHRNNAALRMAIGKLHQAQRGPGEVLLGQFQTAQRIPHMGIEAGRDDQQVRREGIKRRQDDVVHRLAELRTTITGPQWRVEDVAHARFIHRT